jgi:hypothetical protein
MISREASVRYPEWSTTINLRVPIALAAGLVGGLVCAWIWAVPHPFPSDLGQLWSASQAWARGENPYLHVGPGRAYEWGYPLFYPFPAIIAVYPLTFLPLFWANVVFAGLGWFALAYVLQARPHGLFIMATLPAVMALAAVQWSPLLLAAALTPSLGFLLLCKPTIGAALWLAYPSRAAVYGVSIFCAISLIIWPEWITEWKQTWGASPHVKAPVTYWGGPLLLLAWLKWRTWEGRLLGAFALVPQTPIAYEWLPLFLIPQTMPQRMTLTIGAVLAWGLPHLGGPYPDNTAAFWAAGQWMVVLVYLPCLWMVLKPFEGYLSNWHDTRT